MASEPAEDLEIASSQSRTEDEEWQKAQTRLFREAGSDAWRCATPWHSATPVTT